jgi:hypothetical protein
MEGWMLQWYGSVPAAVIANGALVAPGAMPGVEKPPPSCAMAWVIESAFLQATVWPAFTAAAAGEKDCPPAIPWIVIVTSAAAAGGGAGVGVEGLVGDE